MPTFCLFKQNEHNHVSHVCQPQVHNLCCTLCSVPASRCKLDLVAVTAPDKHTVLWEYSFSYLAPSTSTLYCEYFSLPLSVFPKHSHTNTIYLHQHGCSCVAFIVALTAQPLREWRSISGFFVHRYSTSRFRTLVPLSQSILGSEPCYVPDRKIDLALYIHF